MATTKEKKTSRTRANEDATEGDRQRFGNMLKWHRSKQQLSLRDLGAQTEIAFQHLHEIERGTRPCSDVFARRLSRILKLSGDEARDFLYAAARTQKSSAAIRKYIGYPPDVLDSIARLLEREGIKAEDIASVTTKDRDASPRDPDLILHTKSGEIAVVIEVKMPRTIKPVKT